MIAEISWQNEDKTLLEVRYHEPLTVEDIIDTITEIANVLDTVEHKVVLLVDMTDISTIPRNLLTAYPRIAKTRGVNHPNAAASYIVVDNRVIELITSIFNRMYASFQVVRSLEEAQRLAEERVATLSD